MKADTYTIVDYPKFNTESGRYNEAKSSFSELLKKYLH